VKGVIALVSGYAVLAMLAAPSLLVAADTESVAPVPAEADPAPAAPDPAEAAPPDPAQAPPADTGQPAAPADSTAGQVEEVQVAGRQATHEVAMRDIKFVPKQITVDVGDTITWRNEDSEPHNAIAKDDSFRTETIQQGETTFATINEPGSHSYFCSIHAGMTGTVVAGSAGGGGDGSGGGGGGSGGGSGSSGTSAGASASAGGSSGITSGAASGTSSSSRSGTSILPATGRDELWFAIAGAWLLTVGAAVRAAVSGD
jgi:plastocyanin